MDQAFPLVYALTTNKTEEVYTIILRTLKQKALELRHPNAEVYPVTSMTDFETAAINAFKNVFPNARIHLCFFHFAQSIYRKVQEFGLSQQYNMEDSWVKQWIHSAISLGFVPPENVVDTFNLLCEQLQGVDEGDDALPQVEAIAKYLKITYISGKPARGRRRAVPPRYHPQKWNVYERTLNGEGRTNNIVEGYHNRLNKMVNKHHVSMFTMLSEIQKEQRDTEVAITQLHAGHGNVRQNRSKRAEMKETRILNIVQRYEEYRDNNDIATYLRSLGYNIVPRA